MVEVMAWSGFGVEHGIAYCLVCSLGKAWIMGGVLYKAWLEARAVSRLGSRHCL